LIEDNLKSVGDQSPTRELDSDFLWVPRRQVRAKPEREAEEEEFRGLILIQDSPASSRLKWCVLKAHAPVYAACCFNMLDNPDTMTFASGSY
jgi:hypothetical protein